MRPPPTEAAFRASVRPVRLFNVKTAVFGCAARSSTGWMVNFIPAFWASAKLSGRRGSSGCNPSRPATRARSVPWPLPVVAKLPYNPISASAGISPSSFWAVNPIFAAPAVWLEEGPIITGPRTSNRRMGCTSFLVSPDMSCFCPGKCRSRHFFFFLLYRFCPTCAIITLLMFKNRSFWGQHGG